MIKSIFLIIRNKESTLSPKKSGIFKIWEKNHPISNDDKMADDKARTCEVAIMVQVYYGMWREFNVAAQ